MKRSLVLTIELMHCVLKLALGIAVAIGPAVILTNLNPTMTPTLWGWSGISGLIGILLIIDSCFDIKFWNYLRNNMEEF
jgi:hypothetical protein